MKIASITSALILASAGMTFAQDSVDADGDGLVTIDELVAVYADVTAETFSEADGNDDGTLDADELAAAQEAGLIPTEM